jgi:hypothetical protein
MPSANDLVKRKDLPKVKNYPLVYYWCPKCTLLQQLNLIESEKLFRNYYTYMTGVNRQTVELFTEEARMLKNKIRNKDLAIVIASNDGTEVKLIRDIAGFRRVVGVEPAKNIAKIANERGLTTINEFFTYKLSNRIIKEYGKADLIVANNVFAHIPYPTDMLAGMKNLIKPSGLIEIEVHWLRDMVKDLQIDILYAEHYYEWSLRAMQTISRRYGLKVVNAEHLPKQQGGSIRFWLALRGKETNRLSHLEKAAGVYSIKTIKRLQERSDARKGKLVALINKLKEKDKVICIWSVPAKIATVLNFCNITNKEITCAYEVAPTKIGRFIPKSNIEIKDEKHIATDMPDYLIVGAWNYMDFAKKSLGWYIKKGGKLIDPLTCKILP